MNDSPSPHEIREARLRARLSQTEAARVLDRSLRGWQYWESGERNMSRFLFETFVEKVKE